MGCLWDACGMPVGCLWDDCGMPVGCLWDACEAPVWDGAVRRCEGTRGTDHAWEEDSNPGGCRWQPKQRIVARVA